MANTDAVAMDDDERDEFLGDGGTGVVSLSTAAEDGPHSIPASYGYDAAENTLSFRLAWGRTARRATSTTGRGRS